QERRGTSIPFRLRTERSKSSERWLPHQEEGPQKPSVEERRESREQKRSERRHAMARRTVLAGSSDLAPLPCCPASITAENADRPLVAACRHAAFAITIASTQDDAAPRLIGPELALCRVSDSLPSTSRNP